MGKNATQSKQPPSLVGRNECDICFFVAYGLPTFSPCNTLKLLAYEYPGYRFVMIQTRESLFMNQ